jgi:hypothetical protein
MQRISSLRELFQLKLESGDIVLFDLDETLVRLNRVTQIWSFTESPELIRSIFVHFKSLGATILGFTARFPTYHSGILELFFLHGIHFSCPFTYFGMSQEPLSQTWLNANESKLLQRPTLIRDGIVYGAYQKQDGHMPWWGLGKGGLLIQLMQRIPVLNRVQMRRIILVDDRYQNLVDVHDAIYLLRHGASLSDKQQRFRYSRSWHSHLLVLPELTYQGIWYVPPNSQAVILPSPQKVRSFHQASPTVWQPVLHFSRWLHSKRDAFLRYVDQHHLRLMAWDFDQTIVAVHTGNKFAIHKRQTFVQQMEQLAQTVSFAFRCICMWIHLYRPTLLLAVVSFSDSRENGLERNDSMLYNGEPLIRSVLDQSLGQSISRSCIPVIVSYTPSSVVPGKTNHLNKVLSLLQLPTWSGSSWSHSCPYQLMDDDAHNCRMSQNYGWKTGSVALCRGFTWDDFDATFLNNRKLSTQFTHLRPTHRPSGSVTHK